ncbi:DEAD/DEAH box helicase [Tessaracoccus flavescens]|uniref:RNA helicase n=1 Tax=Tessaracoccus flavescens TaxID=399497 RepID=A0A1Q2CXW6_9ACTN|nr:DEAD/DEAH box helicase [Tessaracoccus flavescens]AQP50948.1 RNA helicase [Tessaracoccus flavescens]
MSSNFARLGVPTSLVTALQARGITTPTPIQEATLPDSLAGRDVLGRGRTGSGKTFAFLLPLVARLAGGRQAPPKKARSLILAPTRELASQIEESLIPLAKTAGLSHVTVFGGVNQNPQVRALAKGVDVLVACPGRLLDLMGQGAVDLSAVTITIIDEADHMADMGFLPMVRRILDKTPQTGQRMLFSATLDQGVGVLVKAYLHNPVTHEADSAQSPVAKMDHHVLKVDKADRIRILADLAAAPGKTIMFTRTKHGAKKLARQLVQLGVPAVDLHGNLAQNARTRNLDAFHSGAVQTLVATDIAARGIHVDDVELVVHADPPAEHKAYLHRSGRTARAGKAGTVLTLATPDQTGEVRSLMRAAKISPTIASTRAGDQLIVDLAPGERVYLSPEQADAAAHPNRPQQEAQQPKQRGGARRPRRGPAKDSPRDGAPRGGGRDSGPRDGARSGTPRDGGTRRPRQESGARSGGRGRSGAASSGSNKGVAGFSAQRRRGR